MLIYYTPMSSLCCMDLPNLLLGEVLFFFFQAWWLDLPTDLWSGILMPTPPWGFGSEVGRSSAYQMSTIRDGKERKVPVSSKFSHREYSILKVLKIEVKTVQNDYSRLKQLGTHHWIICRGNKWLWKSFSKNRHGVIRAGRKKEK